MALEVVYGFSGKTVLPFLFLQYDCKGESSMNTCSTQDKMDEKRIKNPHNDKVSHLFEF